MSLAIRVLVIVTGVIVNIHAQILGEQKIQSYASCRSDVDCKSNAFCFDNDDNKDGKCKCKDGYELIRNTTFYDCLPAIKLGDACTIDIQCQITAGELAFCDKYKICSCNEESHEYEGKCPFKAKIGQTCLEDANCYIDDGTPTGRLGFCTYGHCACGIHEKPSADGTQCLASKKLGDPCVADEECSITTPNTRCIEKCVCHTAYTVSRNESSCVKAATKFDDPCDYDGQCSLYLQEGICNKGKCGCKEGFHGYSIRCVETRRIGERCDDDAQCLYQNKFNGNVKCSQGMCTCIYGKQEDGSCKIEKSDNSSASQLSYATVCIEILFILVRLLFIKY